MNLKLMISVLLATGILAACGGDNGASGGAVGAKAPAFSLDATDAQGASRKIDSAALEKPTALVFMSTSCPFCEAYADRLSSLSATYGPRGVDLVYVYPNRKESDESKAEHHAEKKLGGLFANDKGATVAKALSIGRTPEVVILGKDGMVLFQGGIDDDPEGKAIETAYFAQALDEHLANKPVSVTSAPAPG